MQNKYANIGPWSKYSTLTTKLAIGMLDSILIFHKGYGEGGMSSFYGLHQ